MGNKEKATETNGNSSCFAFIVIATVFCIVVSAFGGCEGPSREQIVFKYNSWCKASGNSKNLTIEEWEVLGGVDRSSDVFSHSCEKKGE